MADTGFARGPAFFGTFLETNVRLYSVDRTGRRRAYRSTLRSGSPRVRRARRARQAAAGSRDVQRRPGGTTLLSLPANNSPPELRSVSSRISREANSTAGTTPR
ncbi:MAG TPA: hypothetical protein VF328_25665, partial [Mycobacterium sp.]